MAAVAVDRQRLAGHAVVRTRCGPPTIAGGRHRRVVYRRRAGRTRLSAPSGIDCRTLRPRSVRDSTRPAHVSHRRSGTLARRRRDGIPRPQRRSGQAARLSHRTGRDRSGIAGLPGRARGGSAAARGSPWRQAPGRLSGRRRTAGGASARPASRALARLHGADGVCRAAGHSDHQPRQAGSPGPACAGCHRPGGVGLRRARRRTGNPARHAVVRAARRGARRPSRQFLRPRRAFAARRAADRAHPQCAGPGAAVGNPVRPAAPG